MIEPRLASSATASDVSDPLIQVVNEVRDRFTTTLPSWQITRSSDPMEQWLQFHNPAVTLPLQGWKLHISAHTSSACEVLHSVLPILLTHAGSFKMTSSLSRLALLNQGRAGNSQIGKFITVYPRSDDEAVTLAVLLDKATQDLEGVSIPSDRALRPGSLIYYRYGGFSSQLLVQNAIGLIIPAIRAPEHELEPDLRHVPYKAPSWATDPFIRAGVAADLPAFQRILAQQYVLASIIATSINSTIYLGCDLEAARTCVIKGPGFAHYNNYDSSSRFKVQYEMQILQQMMPNAHIPTPFAVVEQDRNHYLVMEDIEGETLDAYRNKRMARGQYVSLEKLFSWSRHLCQLLDSIHERNLIYTDMKPSNVMLNEEGLIYLIDFELTHEAGDADPKWHGCGTPGYMSPAQQQGQPATVADDIYGYGAFLYAMLTGAEPSYAPLARPLLDRPSGLLRPGLSRALQGIVERALAADPQVRYRSMSDLSAELDHAEQEGAFSPVPFGGEPFALDEAARAHYSELAHKLLATLCHTVSRHADAWESAHPISYGLLARDINTGNSGTLLAMAELSEEFADARGKALLQASSAWLDASLPKSIQPLPGLYVGEAGVGTALLRAGQLLRDTTLLQKAALRGHTIATLSYGSPDLFNGTAGRLRFHLFLWHVLQDDAALQAAQACGSHLLETALSNAHGDVWWRIPEGYDSLSGQEYLGYAHGAAGIADTLLDLFDVTGDERLLPAIMGAGQWLARLAQPGLDDLSGLNWPRVKGEPPTAAFWCHGAGGIGRFFLHASQTGLFPDAAIIAERAAIMVARGTRNAGPTHCHGLPGNIEFLLDMYRATHNAAYTTEAYALAKLLEAFAQEQEGNLVFPSERPDTFTPDYMVGYAGVALCFLRLSAPERIPYQLSSAGFRYRA